MMFRLLSPAPAEGAAPEKFETLLARLEQIVTDMENGDLPLEKLLASYEEGMRLVKSCGDRLTDAEQKVEILSRAVTSEAVKGAPVEIDTEIKPEPEGEDEEEIRLF